MFKFKIQYFFYLFGVILVYGNSIKLTQEQNTISKDSAYYVSIAHCPDQQITSWTCNNCTSQFPDFKNVTLFHSKHLDALAYTGYNERTNEVIVAFRGAVSFINAVMCVDAFYKKTDYCKDCKVHSGFWKTYKTIQSGLIQSVVNLKKQYPDSVLLVTGHSMGGAMATFASLDLRSVGLNVDYIITFGQPRTGNKNYADFINNQFETVLRHVHYRDPIPHLPFKHMGYQHVSTEIWYYVEDSSQYKVCNGPEDPTCSDSVKIFQYIPNDHNYYLQVHIAC